MIENREILTARLNQQLGTLVSSVEIAIRNNLSSSNVVAETTLAGLLNRICGWELVNANAISQNYPGVDLIDEKQSIAVQVTSTRSVEKVRHTLTEVAKLGITFKKLIVLIITNQAATPAMTGCSVPGYTGPMEIWNIPDVFRTAKELETDRLREITVFMDKELGFTRAALEALPHLALSLSSKLQSTGFVGREAELAEIRRRFAEGDKLVVLTGLGGIGKTELATRYGRSHSGTVYFIRFDTSFTRTLANMARAIRPPLSDEALRQDEGILADMVLRMLENSGHQDLLIIDNADSETGSLEDLQDDPGYGALTGLPLRLLVTTRSDAPGAIPVTPLPDEALIQIFQNYGAKLTEEDMTALIRAVNGHTMTIDLIARTLVAKTWQTVTAADILKALREHTLRYQKYRKITTHYSQSSAQAQIYTHLSVVFDVSGVPDAGKAVLRCATLLPEDGMDSQCFGNSLDPDAQEALYTLLDRGWLEVRDDLLTIHPVIRLVCREELQPGDDCGDFLNSLWKQFNPKEYDRVKYAQMAEVFAGAVEITRNAEAKAKWLNSSGRLWNDLMESRRAAALYEQHLPELEQQLPDHPELATAYNNVGSTYGHLGNHSRELEFKLKALALCEKVLPQNHPDLAASYNNVGYTYCQLGDHNRALEYLLKALAIREKMLPENHPDLAVSYNNVGYTYGDLGDHNNELEYQLKALAIREKVLPENHPQLAQSYNNVGITYGDLGDHNKELEYLLKALAIREKVLPENHPQLATSYNNVGCNYSYLGDHNRALEFKIKALAIREKVLPENHPDLAASYNNVGYTYDDLGDHSSALEYQLKALAIREKVLPQNHPSLANSCNNIAWTFCKLGQFPEAARYMRRAADVISRSSLPEDHPKRVNYTQWAAQLEQIAKTPQ